MKLHTHACDKNDVAINDITDETIWKLQELGIKFTDQNPPILPSGSMILFANPSGSITKRLPEVTNSPQHK